MAEAAPQPAGPPTFDQARGWIGCVLDTAGGSRVGRVQGVFADAPGGEPAWLIAALSRRRLLPRRRAASLVAVPVRDCAAGGGRVWTAHESRALRTAPTVDPARPLLREHELAICAHYGIGERVGRAAEVAARPEGSVSSQPSY